MSKHLFARAAIVVSALASTAPTFAATKTLCENIVRPDGYLTVQVDILNGSCPTGKAIKYSTPSNGLVILKGNQLQGLVPPYAGVSVTTQGSVTKTKIMAVVDGLVACASPPVRPYQFFHKPATKMASCPMTGPDVGNSVKYHQHMWVELAKPAGKPGVVRVNLNTNWTAPARNYAIKVTSNLHGGTTNAMKTGLTASGSYTLQQIAPDLVAQAKQGATFTFTVELFQASTSISRYSIQATGQEMIKN